MKLARVSICRDSWYSRTTAWKRPIPTLCPNRDHLFKFSTPKVTGIRQHGNAGSTDSPLSPASGTFRDDVRCKSDQPRRVRRPWTSDEIKIITEGCDAGLSNRAIARLLPDRKFDIVTRQVHLYLAHGASVFASTPHRRWTQDEKARLLDLHREGLAIAEMELQFPHRSFHSIQMACRRLKLEKQEARPRRSNKPWTSAENELSLALAARGINDRSIAKLLDRTMSGVTNQMNKLGVHELRRKWSPEKDNRLSQLRRAGVSLLEIAGLLGTTFESAQARWAVIRPPETVTMSSRRRQNHGFRLTPGQMKEIEDLRRRGFSWHAIQNLNFPEVAKASLYTMYIRQGGILLYKKSHKGKDSLSMSSADIELIQRLRHEGKTWQDISDQICPKKTPTHVSIVFRRHLAMRGLEESKAATSSGPGDAS